MQRLTGRRLRALVVLTTALAACAADRESDECELGCETVLDLCGPERSSPGCVERCRAARLDDAIATTNGLECIARMETCDQITGECGVSLDGDFRQAGAGGFGGSSPGTGGEEPGPADRLCTDTCVAARDGICDDGGSGAEYSVCQLGSDCTDCGLRSAVLCIDACEYARDGQCDDSLTGATSAACAVGTDCEDCGPRSIGGPEGCRNTCRSAFDGRCDDGGPGSDIRFCDFGTDCADCGPR